MEKSVVISRRMLIYLLIVAVVSLLGLSIFGAWYSSNVQNETERKFVKLQSQSEQRFVAIQQMSDHRWCELFGILDIPVPPGIKDPVQRARSIKAQKAFHTLRVKLGCIPESAP